MRLLPPVIPTRISIDSNVSTLDKKLQVRSIGVFPLLPKNFELEPLKFSFSEEGALVWHMRICLAYRPGAKAKKHRGPALMPALSALARQNLASFDALTNCSIPQAKV
jgi:hypothetical protein